VCQVSGQLVSGAVRTSNVWDRLSDGRYVSDAYLVWPGGPPSVPRCAADTFSTTARVNGSSNLRGNASTLLSPLGTVQSDVSLAIMCQLAGERVQGTVRSSDLWDRLANGTFISDGYVAWPGGGHPSVPWCSLTSEEMPAAGEPFVAWAAGFAQEMKATYRVPAAVTIAQAILESGWGTSGLTQEGNNLFGMKCFDAPGTIATGCRPYGTSECDSGVCYRTNAAFRVYASAAASFKDHSHSLAALPRYRGAFAFPDSPDQFAKAIHEAGYATSPTYAQDLIAVMHKYDLYRFDKVT
jgi:hypothetical protein